MIDRSRAEHLEVLRRPLVRRVRLIPSVHHTRALDRFLRDAVDHLRLRQASRFQNRRYDVDHVVELIADAALVLNARWPGHGHAVAGAAEVRRHLLGPLVGSVKRPGPADRIVRVSLVCAPDVVELHVHFHRRLHTVQIGELAIDAIQCSLGARAIIATDVDDERVIELANVLDRLNHATNLGISVSEEGPINVGFPDIELLGVVGQRVPFRNGIRPSGELRVLRNHTQLLLIGEDLLPHRLVAFVEEMHVADLLDPLRRRMMRRMRAAGRVVNHERPIGLNLVQHLDVSEWFRPPSQ